MPMPQLLRSRNVRETSIPPEVVHQLETILASPAAQAVLAEAELPRVARRRQLLAEIAAADEGWMQQKPSLDRAVAEAQGRIDRAEADLLRARTDVLEPLRLR